MPINTAASTRTTPTSGATFDVTFPSGFGTPVAYVIVVSGGTTNGSEVTSRPLLSIGMGDGTNNICYAVGAEAAVAGRENNWYFASTVDLIAINNQSGSGFNGRASFNSLITDGIRLNIDTAFSQLYQLKAWAVNGAGVEAYVGTDTGPAPSASRSVTAAGFQPNCGIALGNKLYSASPTWIASEAWSIGFFADNPAGIQNSGLAWLSPDNLVTTDIRCHVSSGYCTAGISSPPTPATPEVQAFGRVSAFLSNGVTLRNDWSDGAIAGWGFLMLKLPNAGVWTDVIDVSPSTTDYDIGFIAQTLFAASSFMTTANAIQAGAITDQNPDVTTFGFGFAANRTAIVQGCGSAKEADLTVVPYNSGAVSDNILANLRDNSTGNMRIQVDSWRAAGFRLADVLSSPAGTRKWPVLAIGNGLSLAYNPRTSQKAMLKR